MPRGLFAFLISFYLVCAGCGGGGGNNAGSGTGGTPQPQNVPTISSIAPSTANAGSPSLTITLYGSNFDQSAKVKWNGANLVTSWVNASMLTAVVPAPNLSGAGAAQILVSNLQADSASRTFTISPTLASGTWVRAVSGISNPRQMIFDSAHAKLYVTMPSTDPSASNTIIPIDPVSGVAGIPVPAGNSPNLMSISSDSSYLWVADDGDGTVQRFLLPGLKADISFHVPLAIGGGAQQAIALEAAQASPHAVAMVAGDHNISPPGNGVYVFDDAVQRPSSIAGWGHGTNGPPINWIQWGASDAVIYGMMGGFYKLDVDAAGVTWTQPAQGSNLSIAAGARYERTSGLLHFANWTFDPVKNMQAGFYGGGGQGGVNISGGCGATAVNPALGRFYCVDKLMYENPRLLVFDEQTYDFIGQTDLGTTITGSARTLIPWGNAGSRCLPLMMAMATGLAVFF
jgi:DNA-binding beta-propeller fold protein YncE